MTSAPLSIRAVELGDSAALRLAAWRQNLTMLSAGSIGGIGELDEFGRELRGAAAVATLAEMERLLRELLVALTDEIDRAANRVCDLAPCLRTLAGNAYFQAAMAAPKGDAHWDNRVILTSMDSRTEIARFPRRSGGVPQPPLDGRTIRSTHIYRVWATLGLPGEAIPRAEMAASLNALALLRNDVAHGNVPLSEVFHPQVVGKSSIDIANHIYFVERLVDHVALSFSEYGSRRLYEASSVAGA